MAKAGLEKPGNAVSRPRKDMLYSFIMKPARWLSAPPREPAKLQGVDKFTAVPSDLRKRGFAFPKDFKAAVITDPKGSPRYFVFDTLSLWDLLCASDEKLEASASIEEYAYRNPAGWLIDAIEAFLPLNPRVVRRLKRNMREAERLGLVPLAKIKRKLGLG